MKFELNIFSEKFNGDKLTFSSSLLLLTCARKEASSCSSSVALKYIVFVARLPTFKSERLGPLGEASISEILSARGEPSGTRLSTNLTATLSEHRESEVCRSDCDPVDEPGLKFAGVEGLVLRVAHATNTV